jgi:hypothetical protein
MKLRPMNNTEGEEKIRTLVNKSDFGTRWRVYMHPIVSIDGAWFSPELGGCDLRRIWLHRGSISSMLPKVIDQEVWDIWHDIEGIVVAVPTAVIHNIKSGEAIMVNMVDDIADPDQMRISLAAGNTLVKELPTLYFTEKQLAEDPEEVMMWLCRAFLDPGQSHLALVRGDHKVAIA